MSEERPLISPVGRFGTGTEPNYRGPGSLTTDAKRGNWYSEGPLGRRLRDATAHWALACILLLGVVLRGALWAQHRSLWLDESRLALNIATRNLWQLARPLSFDQVAPIPFLWLERGFVVVFGVGESALRLLPLLAGLGLLVLVWMAGRKLFDRNVAVLATLLSATSPTLVSASTEVKQYTYEALVACALVYVTISWLETPSSKARTLVMIVAGALGVWATPTAAFVLIGMMLAVAIGARGQSPGFAPVVLTATLWVCSALGAYHILYAPAANSAYLRRYWSPAFLVSGRPGVLTDSGVALRALVRSPVWRDSFVGEAERLSIALTVSIAVCLALIGIIGARSAARKWGACAVGLLVGPVAATLLASVLGRYPLSGRTTMFLLPLGLTVLAAGLWEFNSRLFHGWALRLVLSMPVAFLLWFAGEEIFMGDRREDLKPLLRKWELERTNGEPIYVLAGAIPAWAFYSTDWQAPDRRRLRYLETIASSTGAAFENASHWSAGLDAQGQRYVGSRGIELYGAPTGIEAHAFGLRHAVPDSGWAESEASRIHGAAGEHGIWLLFAHFYGPEGQLLDALQADGGYATVRENRNGAALLHYRFR